MAITHTTQATLANDASKEVSKNAWNEAHTIDDNTIVAANLSATQACVFGATAAGAAVEKAVTGTGSVVLATSPALTTPNLGTPSAGVLTNCTGLPVAGGGTGLATVADAAVIVTNAANTFTALTAGALQSIRRNAGNTAWEAYTPGAGGGASLDGITAAAADQAGISNGDWNIVWNWQKTTNSEHAFTFGESAASTNGTSTSGVPNQSILKLATLAASTASPLTVYSRGSHVFSVSPDSEQILFANSATNSVPTISFAVDKDTGFNRSGTNEIAVCLGGGAYHIFKTTQLEMYPAGSASVPALRFQDVSLGLFRAAANQLAVTCNAQEIVRWAASSAGGGWQIMDEADSNPTTTNLDAADSFAMYMKADKLVFAHNVAGTMNYLTIPLDGSSTAWTQGTTAP